MAQCDYCTSEATVEIPLTGPYRYRCDACAMHTAGYATNPIPPMAPKRHGVGSGVTYIRCMQCGAEAERVARFGGSKPDDFICSGCPEDNTLYYEKIEDKTTVDGLAKGAAKVNYYTSQTMMIPIHQAFAGTAGTDDVCDDCGGAKDLMRYAKSDGTLSEALWCKTCAEKKPSLDWVSLPVKREAGQHKFVGWPNAHCVYCGRLDPMEAAVSLRDYNMFTQKWADGANPEDYDPGPCKGGE